MADEKKFANEVLSDEELEGVAGGTKSQSMYEISRLSNELSVGFYPGNDDASIGKLGALYARAGMRLDAHNTERDKHGNVHYNQYFQRYPDGSEREISQGEAFGKLYFAIQHGMNTNV